MSREQLLSNLRQLHQLLQEENHPDTETRSLLETVTHDIQNSLHAPAPAPESEPVSSGSMIEPLRLALFDFKARHPNLSGLIERITDALAGVGI
jgi:hypothetical protein